ncbi:MAG: dihydroneopterin aldolase [Actinomycetota bacterium]|nr:dihydroneopterin aldolase [Actinomycetota bacterium]
MLEDDRETTAKITDGSADLLPATLFRARVEGLVVHARCGVTEGERAAPQALRIDLDYLYEPEEGDEIDKTVDYSSIVEGVAGVIEREEFRLLETGARMVGEHILEGYTLVREVTVIVTKLRVPVEREVLKVSVEATFSR